jgi:hypothetical protein
MSPGRPRRDYWPATGWIAALITNATGRRLHFVGKQNPMMFRSALNRIEAHSEKYDVGRPNGHRRRQSQASKPSSTRSWFSPGGRRVLRSIAEAIHLI